MIQLGYLFQIKQDTIGNTVSKKKAIIHLKSLQNIANKRLEITIPTTERQKTQNKKNNTTKKKSISTERKGQNKILE